MNTMDYLNHPNKWQAFSHPDLAKSSPEELFKPDFAELYNRLHQALWHRMVRVHGTLYTLSQLQPFPFDFLYGPNDMEFWRLVVTNFRDLACVLLHGLFSDIGGNAHTISSFKNKICEADWLRPERQELLFTTLRDRKYDVEVEGVAQSVSVLRNKCIAHSVLDMHGVPMSELVKQVGIEELCRLYDAAHALFGAISFGAAYATLAGDLMPSTAGGEPLRTCLDKVLDGVVRDDFSVNMPERRPQIWLKRRGHMSPQDHGVLNELRGRIGLPEA